MPPRIALLASPLLGPASWEPVVPELRRAGWDAVVAAHAGPAPSSAADVITAFLDALAADDEWILVPHSNAGLLAPSVARQRHVRAVVYVDARLPENGVHPMSPDSSLQFLADRVDDDGVLLRWSDWWDTDIGHLFPSAESDRRCRAEMRRLPLAYFKDTVDASGWTDVPSAYLAFGDVYDPERTRAASLGLPVATMAGAHLHMLIDPAGVATQIGTLLTALNVD